MFRHLAGLVALALTASPPTGLVVTPSTCDFGKTAVKGLSHRELAVTFPQGGSGPPTGNVIGRDAGEFMIDNQVSPFTSSDPRNCDLNWQSGSCSIQVTFRPTSLGPKTATLIVTDTTGDRSTVSLRGEGVEALCEMTVVFCNYAHLYSGSFAWAYNLDGPGSHYKETVTVKVIGGRAACEGSVVDEGNGETTVGTILGDGLIAVEFERDDTYRPVYRITAACPSPSGMGAPVRPAELGHWEQKSYDQDASKIQPGMALVGSNSYPAPETDQVNGVTGQVRVTWSLQPQ